MEHITVPNGKHHQRRGETRLYFFLETRLYFFFLKRLATKRMTIAPKSPMPS